MSLFTSHMFFKEYAMHTTSLNGVSNNVMFTLKGLEPTIPGGYTYTPHRLR